MPRDRRYFHVASTLAMFLLAPLIVALWGVVAFGTPNAEVYASVGIITVASFWGWRGSAAIPFAFFSFMYLLLFFWGQLFVSVGILEYPPYYSTLVDPALLEFAIYFAAAASGFSIIARKHDGISSEIITTPYFSVGVVSLLWAVVVLGVLLWMDWGNPIFRIVLVWALPALSVAFIWSLNNNWGRMAIFCISILPAILIGSRHLAGQFIVWVTCFYFLLRPNERLSIRRQLVICIGIIIVGSVVFSAGTVSKYGLDKLSNVQHYVSRFILVQSHATAQMISFKNRYPQEAYEYYGGHKYWLSLVPGIDKPTNAGHRTYEISRKQGKKEDMPYLPPGGPGEVYLTGGWIGLVMGGLFHGMIISALWRLGRILMNNKIHSSFIVGLMVSFIGVGTPSLYRRFNSIKEALAVLLVLAIALVLMSGGKLFRRVRQEV